MKNDGVRSCLIEIRNNTEIFSFVFLLLLPCCSSTFRQTNDDNRQNDPEDNLLFSRIQSLHQCLEVDFHDEEDRSVSSTLDNRRANVFWFNISPSSLPNRYSSCG